MKKVICLLAATLLACMGATAFADQTPEKFEHLWIRDNEENDTVDILDEDGRTDVFALFSLQEDELLSVEFEKCEYDAEKDALICEGGVLTREMMTEAEEDEGTVIADGFSAILTVDENGLLHWTGSGDAVPDQTFVNGDEEDDGRFTGDWESGDEAGMSIIKHGDLYTVSIAASVDDTILTEWEYVCTMNESGALTGKGIKTITTFDENDEIISEKEVYTDGEATFTADSGSILWDDAKEAAGNGLRFERTEDEPDDQAGSLIE